MAKTEVLFNDSCPICSREIKHYDALRAKDDLNVAFHPLDDCDAWGVTPDAAARRIHARRGEQMLVGVPAFIAMWEEIPRYRWLARLCSLPVVRPLVGMIYNGVLAPALYGMHRRRQRRLGK